jgi:hypothetical protein
MVRQPILQFLVADLLFVRPESSANDVVRHIIDSPNDETSWFLYQSR